MSGKSGNALDRCVPVTASARSLLARICGAIELPANMILVSPAIAATVAGEPHLNGIWVSAMPARFLSVSIAS